MTTTSDAAALRAAAEAQVARLRGPLWTGEQDAAGAECRDGDEGAALAAEPESAPVPTGKRRGRVMGRRAPGRPTFETQRLPRREVRIPVVVDERARAVAAWGGIEPTDAIWLLASLGWDSWRREHGEEAA